MMQQLYAEALGDLPDIFWKASEGQVRGNTTVEQTTTHIYTSTHPSNLVPVCCSIPFLSLFPSSFLPPHHLLLSPPPLVA